MSEINKLYGIVEAVDYHYEAFNEARKIDGVNVLGVLKGGHFAPNGHSRNGGRFYSEGLWAKQFGKSGIRECMANGRMLGSIGHDLDLTDENLRKGLFSHYTKAPNPKTGYAETYVLTSPTGQVLHSYLSGGVKLFFSSRAEGSLAAGQRVNGRPVVDEDSFKLERFDIVMNPGFLQAHSKYGESLCESMEEIPMIPGVSELFEDDKSEADKKGPDNKPKEGGEGSKSSSKDKDKSNKPGDKGKNEFDGAPEIPARADDSICISDDDPEKKYNAERQKSKGLKENSMTTKNETMSLEEALQKIGVLQEGKGKDAELVENMKSLHEQNKTLIDEQVAKIKDLTAKLESYEAIGEAEGLQEKLTEGSKLLSEYEKTGTPEKVNEALDTLVEYKELGTLKGITDALDLVERYLKIDTPEDITEVYEKSEAMVKKTCEDKKSAIIEAVKVKFNCTDEAVTEILETGVKVEKLAEFMENFKKKGEGGNATDRYMSENKGKGDPNNPPEAKRVWESDVVSKLLG